MTVTVTGVPALVSELTVGEIVIVAPEILNAPSTPVARLRDWLSVPPSAVTTRAPSYAAEVSDCFKKIALEVSIDPRTRVTSIGKHTANSTVEVPRTFRRERAACGRWPKPKAFGNAHV